MKLPHPTIGLRSATPEEIEELKRKYPTGYHKTRNHDTGKLLPYNGVFMTHWTGERM